MAAKFQALAHTSSTVDRVQRGWEAANSSDDWVYDSDILLPNGYTPLPPLSLNDVAQQMATDLDFV